MNRLTDQQLLREYTERRSEAAFAELVRRHVDLIYSAARRMVCDSHLAEDVTQGAFVALARSAPQLTERAVLSGWLHRTAQNIAAQTVRTDVRRRAREQEAAAMNELFATEPDGVWEHIAPQLDAALGELSEADRDALMLRYFERKSAQEMARVLGVSDEAAQKRVNRAVERLREFFAKRGVTVGAGGLVAVISANAVQAAPIDLAVTISTAAALAALGLSSVGTGATAGFFGTLLQVARMKLVTGLATAVLVAVVAFILFRSLHRADSVMASDPLQINAANAGQNPQVAGPSTQATNNLDGPGEPDPLSLLVGVARARQRIVSGSLEFQLSVERDGPGRRETNHLRLNALFDGPKLRYEQFGHEYSYTFSDDEAKQDEIRKRADSMDREAAIRGGLMTSFAAHHTTAYDGVSLLHYSEADGKPEGVTIDDLSKGTGRSLFDPRCLGLTTTSGFRATAESCLGYNEAKSIGLIGEELVEGTPAWHVRVQSKYDETLDFWMEVARPERVLRHARGPDIAISRYDGTSSRDPIPAEVTTMEFRNGSPSFGRRFIRSNSRFNVPVDPAAFTLAGLGIAIGTRVDDIRINRLLGFWTGTGFSEFPPPKEETNSSSPPNREDLLARLKYNPTWPEALEAAMWILLNTPDGLEVDKAIEVILREHTRDTNLVFLCKQLERLRPRRSQELLAAILKNNPIAEVRGTACFILATLLKDEAKFGQNKMATAQAERQFERVISEFGQLKERGYTFEELAKPELSELRRLTIGKPAPEIEGKDLDGQAMKLSDYRGRVVVIVFWWRGYIEAPEHRKLAERLAGKSLALVGVYGEDDLAKGKAEVEKYGITWPSFWDKRGGPISRNWRVRGWPDIWVLDRQGVIRYREVRGRELNEAVDALLRE